jgi:hypothetical protein
MKRLRLPFLLLAAAGLLLCGCQSTDPDHSKIPHSRPADFEFQGPAGLGGGGLSNQRGY